MRPGSIDHGMLRPWTQAESVKMVPWSHLRGTQLLPFGFGLFELSLLPVLWGCISYPELLTIPSGYLSEAS